MNNKYKATNKQKKTIILTQQRANYRLQAFKSELGEVPENVVNFNFAERTQYGRVDENMNTVFVKPINLKLLPNNEEAIYVVDFVQKPFMMLQSKMKQATRMKQIPNDPILSNLKPVKGYQSAKNLYLDFVDEYITIFNSTVDKTRLTGYQTWIDEFFVWTKRNGPLFPLTFSNFNRTKMSSIYTSGLAISIADLDAGKDPIKEKLFLNNRSLEFYLNAAKQFGFSVSKSTPWLLVADLNSPALTRYLGEFNLSNVSSVFSEKYNLCYQQDVNLLKQVLERGYRSFISENQYKREIDLNNCNNIKYNILKYNNININKYNNSFYNKLYITARNIEEYSAYTSAELGRIQQKQEIFEKKLDKSEALSYTNEQFRKLVLRRPGGLYSIQQKQKLRSEDE
jgi:hypothetical protein